MATATKKPAGKKKEAKPTPGTQLDLIFAGPLLFVPEIRDSAISAVEVFSPANGHPVGAVFLPGTWLSDAELKDPECERWPAPESFALLDPHGYSLEITQHLASQAGAMKAAAIPDTNHKVRPGRRISHDWEVAIAVRGQLSAWSSHRLMPVKEGFFHGADSPTAGSVASLHKLTYSSVTGADFCGASAEARAYLRQNAAGGGTLIVIGEIPYQSSLLHERRAIDAMARLAGLDLHLATTAPAAYRTQLMTHVSFCALSTIITE